MLVYANPKKRGPGRPKGSKNKKKSSAKKTTKKRGPGRPKGSKSKAAKKRGPGRPKGSKSKSTKKSAKKSAKKSTKKSAGKASLKSLHQKVKAISVKVDRHGQAIKAIEAGNLKKAAKALKSGK